MIRREHLAPVLLRLAVVGVLVGGLAVIRPALVRSSATNPRAWALAAVLVGLALLLPALVRRLGGSPAVASGVGLAPTVVALAVVLVPSFTTTTLDEALPEAFRSTAPATAAPTPPSASPAVPSAVPTTRAPAPAADPTGSLTALDHGARGTVTVVSAGSDRLLRFVDVDIEPAPDHQVHLVPGAEQRSPGRGSVHLGSLKAEKGSFSYPVPAGFDTSAPFTVLLWCGRFASPNAHASLD